MEWFRHCNNNFSRELKINDRKEKVEICGHTMKVNYALNMHATSPAALTSAAFH